jgi:hypothetical protein
LIDPPPPSSSGFSAFLTPRNVKVMGFATAAVVVGSLVWPFVARPGSPTYIDVGQWLSGVLQPIAVFWFVVAFLLQHEELQLQREELKLTRNELKSQAEAAAGTELSTRRTTYAQLHPQVLAYLERCIFAVANIGWPAGPDTNNLTAIARSIDNLLTREGAARSAAIEVVRGAKFREFRDSYIGTFNVLLDLAKRCESPEHPVFVNMLRSEVHFAWYRALHKTLPGNDMHADAGGSRSGDAAFDFWTGTS